jgi:mannan endo-1,4-beta-mannosidase
MKLSTVGISLAFAISAFASPSLLSSSAINQPARPYPIGKAGGANAKVSGRLFEIDGKVEYFAGLFIPKIPFAVAELSKEVMLSG